MADNTGIDNALLASIQIAATDAAARIQAALGAAEKQATAEVDVANIRATADETVATTEADARKDVASIEAQGRLAAVQAEVGWHVAVAGIEATAREQVATTAADAEKASAQFHATATTQSATTQANASTQVASTEAGARTQVASTEAGAATAVAETNAAAQVAAAEAQAGAQVEAATVQGAATVQAATIDAGWHANVAQITANATTQAASIDAGWHSGVATIEAGWQEYQADKTFAGVNAHETAETARLNLKLAFANDKWTTLLPIINQALGIAGAIGTGLTSGGGGGSIGFTAMARPGPVMGFGAAVAALPVEYPVERPDDFQMGHYSRRTLSPYEIRMGGGDVKTGGIGFATGSTVADAVAGTQLPVISTSGVLTPAQIQQQVNAAYARADAKVGSEAARLVEEMTGRGFSANSPILGALRVGLTGQSLRSALLTEQAIRLEGAKANADAVFAAQKAVSDQFTAQEGVLLDHEKNEVTRTVGILSAISQLIGSAL